MFCWIDQWIDMTLTEARLYEEQVADELNAVGFISSNSTLVIT